MSKPSDYLMQFFKYEHLPAGLQGVSKPFCDLAEVMHQRLPENPEKTTALRKLLEAKDCAVRALLSVAMLLLICLPAFGQRQYDRDGATIIPENVRWQSPLILRCESGGTAIAVRGGNKVYAITHAHQLTLGQRVVYQLNDGRRVEGVIQCIDDADDCAAVELRSWSGQTVALGTSAPRPGEWVRFFGFPMGQQLRPIDAQVSQAGRLMTVSRPAEQGDSGGPVLNQAGQLVGVVSGTDGRATYCCGLEPIVGMLRKLQGITDTRGPYYQPQCNPCDPSCASGSWPVVIDQRPTYAPQQRPPQQYTPPSPPAPLVPVAGRDGTDGKNGVDGKDGKDGSPADLKPLDDKLDRIAMAIDNRFNHLEQTLASKLDTLNQSSKNEATVTMALAGEINKLTATLGSVNPSTSGTAAGAPKEIFYDVRPHKKGS